MDWQRAIDRNRNTLLFIIAVVMKSLGLVDGGMLTTLPFCLYRKSLAILRPAEAAVRRLVMMAAYEMELRGVTLRKSGEPAMNGTAPFPQLANFAPTFNLIDPLKNYGSETPDYSSFGPPFDGHYGSADRTPIPAASLGRRLLALKNALDTIEKQARRLTRWYAQRDRALKRTKPHRLSPLRPGFPPGFRKRPQHEVETILSECHGLAQYARERPNSS